MRSPARYPVVPFLLCPLDSAIDFTCYTTLPTKATTCLHVGPMSLEWLVALPAESDQSSPSSSHEDSNDEHREGALPDSNTLQLKAGCSSTTSSTTKYCRSGYMWPYPWRRYVVYYLEKLGSHWISFILAEKQGAQTQIFQVALRQENVMSPGGSREGCVKTTPQKTRFRIVNLCKEIAYRSKLSNWLQRQEVKIDDTKHRAKPNHVWSELKHLEHVWA